MLPAQVFKIRPDDAPYLLFRKRLNSNFDKIFFFRPPQKGSDFRIVFKVKGTAGKDKNPVVALREVAEQTISPEDLKEELIHSLQKYVEVDEPEAEAVPMVPNTSSQSQGGTEVNAVDDSSVEFDRMSEEDLLRGLEGLVPPERKDDI